MAYFVQFTAKFLHPSSEDLGMELLEEDFIFIDLDKVTAFNPTEDGACLLLDNGQSISVKSSYKEVCEIMEAR